jgi:para-nitrobenzyl esterase
VVAGLTVALGLVLILFGVVGAGCGPSGLEQVRLDSGPVTGDREEVNDQGIWIFRGVPYAAPPVGDLRWKPPQAVAAWTEPLECTSFGPSCPQPGQGDSFYVDTLAVGSAAEDCLYLNVWSPAESGEERLPVMVWIHGGSFETGSGSMAVYDGRNLAAQGVVVVTINYRLGPFGFLAHAALSAESPEGVSGNYGLLDQIAALHWVQRNIAGFGGDPGNVTVFGESAGAISILDLLVSPLAEGLFQRAISQSGILLDHGFGVSTTGTLEESEAAGETFAARLGVDGSGDVPAQMRTKTADELLAAMAAVAQQSGLMEQGLTWKPVADGYVLPDLPSKSWAAGERHNVPLLIGTNADEGNTFLSGLVVSAEDYEAQMAKVFGDHVQEALALYPIGKGGDTLTGLSRMLTEIGFASTARFAARSMSNPASGVGSSAIGSQPQATPAYLYQFTRVPMDNMFGAFHGVEIPYVFGTADLFSALGAIEQADFELSAAIMGYWTRFAATGDPNGGTANPVWPRYETASDRHLELGDSVQVREGLYREACDLADRVRGVQ